MPSLPKPTPTQELVQRIADRSGKVLHYNEGRDIFITEDDTFAIHIEYIKRTDNYLIEAFRYPSMTLLAIGAGHTLDAVFENLYRDIDRTEKREAREVVRLQGRLESLHALQPEPESK